MLCGRGGAVSANFADCFVCLAHFNYNWKSLASCLYVTLAPTTAVTGHGSGVRKGLISLICEMGRYHSIGAEVGGIVAL